MAVNVNEDTEFNDALRKHGIIPPREPTPPSPSPPPSPSLEELLDDFTPKELREIGEDAQDDETERMIEMYRRQRIAELQKEEKSRFGRVYPIGRDDYTREVTEASKVDIEGDPGKDTGVVCFLYKDGLPRSDRAFEHIRILATRHPRTKFVSIVGDKCIPNLPETRQPMFIIYRGGEVRNQIIAWGGDRERRVEELEAVLVLCGAIIPTERTSPGTQKGRDSSDEDDDDEPSSRMRSSATRVNGKPAKNVRRSGKKDVDEDSDSDFDL